ASIGGPRAVTALARSLGDPSTRLDRNEPSLNTARPGDARDTTTPAAMAGDLQAVLLGRALKPASRERLTGWMKQTSTGLNRIRAGLPSGWTMADKTGSGERGSTNTIGLVWPPGRAPIAVALYCVGSPRPRAEIEAAHAEVGRLLVSVFG
ncbi:MAG: serine hydrolase, partial [Proteobacteria bacterium]|nr:serine hydrolase [Pseudomonadota bacterium]